MRVFKKNAIRKQARAYLQLDLEPHWQRLHAIEIKEMLDEWSQWRNDRINHGDQDLGQSVNLLPGLITWLAIYIRQRQQRLDELAEIQSRFVREYARLTEPRAQEILILDCAKELDSRPRTRAGDRRALKRWFDHDAILDRSLRRRAQQEQRLTFALERLGKLLALSISRIAARDEPTTDYWRQLSIESLLRDNLSHEGDHRVKLAAFRALMAALRAIPTDEVTHLVEEPTLRYIYRSALERHQDVWIQAEAMAILEYLDQDSLMIVLTERLQKSDAGDDLFVRQRALPLLIRQIEQHPELAKLEDLLNGILHDPSAYVRQQLAAVLVAYHSTEADRLLTELVNNDSEPSVRSAAILACVDRMLHLDNSDLLDTLLIARLSHEDDPLVLRTLLHACATLFERLPSPLPTQWERGVEICQQALSSCAEKNDSIPVRRWAAQAGEKIWIMTTPPIRQIALQLAQLIIKVTPGGSIRVPHALGKQFDNAHLGRILAALAHDDFPLELAKGTFGYRLYRGHRFGFRWWRFLYEFRNTSPDKRQAFSHVIGRHFEGEIRAPSAILNEMSPTKVPGEPLYIENEGGWRPYLPLVDDLISTLQQGQKVTLHTSQGTTEITPPKWPWGRWLALWKLSRHFSHYADLRNYRGSQDGDPLAYLQQLQGMGFSIHYQPQYPDPSVSRFFAAAPALPMLDPELMHRFEEYFFSAYENSIFELLVFTASAMGLFMVRHLWLNGLIRWHRRRIPLVIGGWGTRGKSGTERLKAAVFHAKGMGVLSKTTGCEAMFIHAPPFMPAREMFLFRPYDKATIWEQHSLVSMAPDLDCQVFLWECMALTPSYVQLLQRSWMQDDIATITNAYPDHEDLQGPAGINIPEVIAGFIPEKSHLISSEESMAPILRVEADRVGTKMEEVNWLEASLLPPDILERFPYAEHPNNIALVTKMCESLGLTRDETLKSMADNVIPDIGVLKIYPDARLDGRRISFVNGMSANERLGCLGNWSRTGFEGHDPNQNPDEWIMTVVNNRADRIARTKVFARLLAYDIYADRHILIGGNLEGFHGYIEEELEQRLGQLTLYADSEGRSAAEIWLDYALKMRIPTTEDQLHKRVAALFIGMGIDAERALAIAEQCQNQNEFAAALAELESDYSAECITYSERWVKQFNEYHSLNEQIVAGSQSEASIDQRFKALFREWFLERIVIIWDYHASGDDIIRSLCKQTPPGLHNRVMGIQNIKGTGLDFVYRWQAWDQCHTACSDLLNDNSQIFSNGLRALSEFRDYGPLCDELVQHTVAQAQSRPEAQSEKVQAEFKLILNTMERQLHQGDDSSGDQGHQEGWTAKLLDTLEAFLDAGDAIKRRKLANRIYKDLKNERISRQMATTLLGKIIKRQKGGWLKNSALFKR